MLGQNQGMGKRFVISTFSSYSLCKKTNGRWDAFEATLLTPSNIPPLKYGHFIASFHDY
jgi:hypothetical protein